MPASVRTPSTSVANRQICRRIAGERCPGELLGVLRVVTRRNELRPIGQVLSYLAGDYLQIKINHCLLTCTLLPKKKTGQKKHIVVYTGRSSGESAKGRGEKPRSRAASECSNTRSRFMRSAISTVQCWYRGSRRNADTPSRNNHRGIVTR